MVKKQVDRMLSLAEEDIVGRRAYANAGVEGGLAEFKPQARPPTFCFLLSSLELSDKNFFVP